MSLFSLSRKMRCSEKNRTEEIEEACQKIADGDFSARIDQEKLDEPLKEIARAVNTAIDRAEQRIVTLQNGIDRAAGLVNQLRRGDFEARLVGIEEDEHVAPLLHSLNDFADVTDAFVRESGASLEAVSQNIFFRKVFTTGLSGEFLRTAIHINHATATMGEKFEGFTSLTERLVENIGKISHSISEMSSSVSDVSSIAEDSSQRSTTVAAAVEETTTSLQSIASAAEEMLVSVSEINRQVVHSTDITQDAAQRMTESNAVAQTLSDAAANITDVLNLINTIASQTNLLALNATIEAARAGDAGKGFAVVAGEVKSLASQTAKATEDIAVQVRAMQDATNATVETIERLGGTVSKINEISGAIASAITEQESTTQEISSNIQNAATGSQEVADNMQIVSIGAKKNSEAADMLRKTMDSVEKQSINLVAEATQFLEIARKTGTD